MTRQTSAEFFAGLLWIDGSALTVEPYRQRLFTAALDTFDSDGRPRYNLVLSGRAKKNWKTTDLVLAALYSVMEPGSAEAPCYILANDEDQAGDDLGLAKKLITANPDLARVLKVQKKEIVRRDDRGFLQILPAGDVAGSHGKTARFIGWDEIHGYKNWDILEALQPDPTRTDSLQWITSYASLYHRPGVPLYDLMATGRAGRDPRMLFSWYAADFCTDPAFQDLDPESRANPSRVSWADQGYLEQQRQRLPAHKFRRLHLNLPGLPEGSAYTVEAIEAAMDRGCQTLEPERGRRYVAFVDMSGGSNDDATLGIAFEDGQDYRVARVMNQGQPPKFDPMRAVERFAQEMRRYGIGSVTLDSYGGETFKAAFERLGFRAHIDPMSASDLYEAFEVPLNQGRVVLPNVPVLEQQLLGLVWKGQKITHPSGEHDDWANAVAGCVNLLRKPRRKMFAAEGDAERARQVQATEPTQRVDAPVSCCRCMLTHRQTKPCNALTLKRAREWAEANPDTVAAERWRDEAAMAPPEPEQPVREVVRRVLGKDIVIRLLPDGREVLDRVVEPVETLHHGFDVCSTCGEQYLDVGIGHVCARPWTDSTLRRHGERV